MYPGVYNMIKEIVSIYKEAFKPVRRRPVDQLVSWIKDGTYDVYHIPGAFGLVYPWDDFALLDYFAVDKECRGKGLGSQLLSKILPKYTSLYVEIEMPRDKTGQSRLLFYERAGIKVITNDYTAPCYGAPPQRMLLLCHGMPYHNLDEVVSRIIRDVYNSRHTPQGRNA